MKIDRLVSIIMILLDKRRVSAQELANTFEVSLRTIYRDLDTIDMAGIPIRATPGVGGGFEIMEKYKVDRKVFSTADLSAILVGLAGLSDLVRGDDVVHALAKVRSFVPADRAKDVEVKASQIHIDLTPWMGNRTTQPYLDVVKEALEKKRVLSFEYADRYGSKTARVAEPHQLVLKSNHWYWQGYCRTRHDFRLFRLSRISNLRMKDEQFTPRDFPAPQLDVPDTQAAGLTRITIRVHETILDRVLDFCTHEDIVADGGENYIVQLPFIGNDYYYGVLLSFGTRCEVVEPPRIRREMKRRTRDLAALYG